MAGGNMSILEIFTPYRDDYHECWHIACACSPAMNMCGGFQPEATGVDIISEADADAKCCVECRKIWFASGCPRCGKCFPDNVCAACRTSDASAD